MGLLDQIAQKQDDLKVIRCTVGQKIEQLSEEDKKDLQAALEDSQYYGTVIAKVLGVNEFALRRHRRNMCKCSELLS